MEKIQDQWIIKNPIAGYDGYANMWCCVITNNDGKILQRIYGSTKIEAESNTRLIASAPELLKACLSAKAMYEAQGISDDSRIGGEQYKQVKEAIKKATE